MSLPLQAHIEKDGFRLRGLETSRIDAFSDVVFGFALTLLVVSTQVPHTYAELVQALNGFIPFAIVFYFLMMIWFTHYRFFRRFGAHDMPTMVLNATLLFVVLFYVYPMKFLFTAIALHPSELTPAIGNMYEVRGLMTLYGIGFAAIYLLFAVLYANGLRRHDALELTGLEQALTRSYIVEMAGIASMGILSCIVAWLLPVHDAGHAGWVYLLLLVFKPWHGRRTRRQIDRRRALYALTDSSA